MQSIGWQAGVKVSMELKPCEARCNGHYNCTPDLGRVCVMEIRDLAKGDNTRLEGTRLVWSLG